MKKTIVLLLSFLLVAGCLSACQQQRHANLPLAQMYQARENHELGCTELLYGDIVYRPYGSLPSRLRGEEIGTREHIPEAIICTVQGYDPNEWIVEYLDVWMGGGDLLWKAVGVADIPQELAQYKDSAYNFG